MDELIYLLIKLIAELFGGSKPAPPGRGVPNVPPGAAGPVVTPRQAEIRRRTQGPQGQARRPQPGQSANARRAPARPAPAPAQVIPVVAPSAVFAAKAPPPQVTQVAHHRARVSVDAAAVRRWLRPAVLRNQFILSEIFQPPLSLRDRR